MDTNFMEAVISRLESEESIVVVMGASGAGKSYFIKQVVGSTTIRAGHGLQSETADIEAYTTKINGRQVTMVDTPGFDDTDRSDVDVVQQIEYWLAATYKDNKKLSGIIYLHDIGQLRMDMNSLTSLTVFEKLLGQDALPLVSFATTHWDSAHEPIGAAREEALISNLWEPLIAKGARYARFTGSSTSARSIVSAIIERSTESMPVPPQIQHELVEQGMKPTESAAAQVLHEELLRVKRIFAEKIARLQHGISVDEETLNARERQRVDFEKFLMRIRQEQETLKSSNYTQIRSHEHDISTDDALVNLALRFLIPLDAVSRHIRRLVLMISGKSFNDILRSKVAIRYTRVNWTCKCGEQLFGDFKERQPGSLQVLSNALRGSDTQATSSESTGNEHGNSHPQGSTSSSEGSNGSSSVPSDNPSTFARVSDGSGLPRHAKSGPSIFEPPTAPDSKFLGLFVRDGKFSHILDEIDVSACNSDGALFQKINRKLKEHWEATARRRLSSLLLELTGAVFNQFHRHGHTHVGVMACPAVPPPEEVRARRYVYHPCPIDEPPMSSDAFVHYLQAPETDHTEEFFWGARFPTKLNESFLVRPGVGWGIQILEGPNWALFWTAMTFFTLVSGLVAGLFAWLAGDTATAVAIGVEVAPTNGAEVFEMRQLGDREDGSINSAQLLPKAQLFIENGIREIF